MNIGLSICTGVIKAALIRVMANFTQVSDEGPGPIDFKCVSVKMNRL